MEQVGLVVDIVEDKAIVAVQRHDVCAKCGGCGIAISGRGENRLEALNKANAAIGQRVKIVSDTSHVLKASFMVYIVPLLSLLLGLFLGELLEGFLAGPARLDIIMGVVFLLASFLLVRAYDRKLAGRQAYATVVEILPDDFEVPADERC